MANVKMTKRDYFNALSALVTNADVDNKTELMEFISKQIEQIDRKATSVSAKSAEKKAENEALENKVLEVLAGAEKEMTVKEIMGNFPELSNQKITYLLSHLKSENKVTRNEIKKVPYFGIVK
jgi:hypothetical protein